MGKVTWANVNRAKKGTSSCKICYESVVYFNAPFRSEVLFYFEERLNHGVLMLSHGRKTE